MGRRSEPRVPICFSVTASGFDPSGNPFTVATETSDISLRGACLKGLHKLDKLVAPGKKIEVECEGQKAWYRVQWVGAEDGPRAGRVGLKCLEPGKYIWGIPPKPWEPDTYRPPIESASQDPQEPAPAYGVQSAGAGPARWAGPERREFPRYACRVEADVLVSHDGARLTGTVTDISIGGCYVEMLSPLPVGTAVEVTLTAGTSPMHVRAKVRSSQTGLGMGLSFTGISAEDFEKLRRFAPPDGATSKKTQFFASSQPPSPQQTSAAPPFVESENGGKSALLAQPPDAPGSPAGPVIGHSPALNVREGPLAGPPPVAAPSEPLSGNSRDDGRSALAAAHSPALSVRESPVASPPSAAEALEALARILFRKQVITRAEFDHEIEILRSAKISH